MSPFCIKFTSTFSCDSAFTNLRRSADLRICVLSAVEPRFVSFFGRTSKYFSTWVIKILIKNFIKPYVGNGISRNLIKNPTKFIRLVKNDATMGIHWKVELIPNSLRSAAMVGVSAYLYDSLRVITDFFSNSNFSFSTFQTFSMSSRLHILMAKAAWEIKKGISGL